jgi:pimeloyl-ACP methyl ester carboxylesterase
MPAWFEYYTCRCGQPVEDEISSHDLLRIRAQLHELIHAEAAKLDAGTSGVLLVGSSQGGSVALDAALSYRSQEGSDSLGLAGVAMLRGLPLGITLQATKATAARRRPKAGVWQALPLLAVSGGRDRTFIPRLVTSQLSRMSQEVKLEHRVVPALTHQVAYNAAEIGYFVSWFGRSLGLTQKHIVRIKSDDVLAAIPDEDATWTYDYDSDYESAEDAPEGAVRNI